MRARSSMEWSGSTTIHYMSRIRTEPQPSPKPHDFFHKSVLRRRLRIAFAFAKMDVIPVRNLTWEPSCINIPLEKRIQAFGLDDGIDRTYFAEQSFLTRYPRNRVCNFFCFNNKKPAKAVRVSYEQELSSYNVGVFAVSISK